MRMMLKVQTNAEAGTRAIEDGSLTRVFQEVSEIIKPEAFYVGPQDGKRTMMFFFEMDDSSLIPQISEPFFREVDAEFHLLPVMNREEMMAGLAASSAS